MIHLITTSAQAFAKLFARQTASHTEPSSQEKPSGHESWRTAMGQPVSTFPRRALENVCESGDKKNPAIVPLRIHFNSRVLTPFNRDVSFRSIPGTPGFRQHSTSLHRTAHTRRSAPDFNETSMCSPGKDPWGRRGGARGCLHNTCRTPLAEARPAASH